MPDQNIPADPEIDRVLAEQLGILGAKSVFGAGRHGAKWSAKRLKTEVAHEMFTIPPGQQDHILACLADDTSTLARSFERVDAQDDSVVTARGIVGSGFGSMNPAYVIISVDAQTSTLGIAAHAKEGLINQQTAQKAVDKVASALGL